MFCDASSEGNGGYLVFYSHFTSESKRPVKKRMVHVLNIPRTLEGQVKLMFFSERCFDRQAKTCNGVITGDQSGIVHSLVSSEMEMFFSVVDSERDQNSYLRYPEVDLRFPQKVG